MEVAFVCGADDRFAMPLSITLYSALSTLDRRVKPLIFVLDGGLQSRNKFKIEQCLRRAQPDLRLNWILPKLDDLEGLASSRLISRSTFLRLQIPDLLPESLDRAIYLDCDVIVRRDLLELWTVSLDGKACAGVRDFAFPTIASPGAVEHWPELNLEPSAPYCNAGVLLLDLKAWRQNRLGNRILMYLKEAGDKVMLADQGGINAILGGKWKLLDPRWNVTVSSLPLYDEVLGGVRTELLTSDPWIIHFTSRWKPWHFGVSDRNALASFYHGENLRQHFFNAFQNSGWYSPGLSRLWVYSRKFLLAVLYKAPRKLRLGKWVPF